jgi:hypothetical protein
MATKFYLGLAVQPHRYVREVFRCAYVPTWETHGSSYNAVVGPFRTKRGAEFMRDHGQGNPHLQTVDDAERIAMQYGPRSMVNGAREG